LEGKVERPNRVRIKAQNLEGQKFSLKSDQLLARAIQHEYDHLEGILYIDYIKSKKDLKKIGK
ncbi:MAG: Peptide deformylase, partial [uncultured bacterium]